MSFHEFLRIVALMESYLQYLAIMQPLTTDFSSLVIMYVAERMKLYAF